MGRSTTPTPFQAKGYLRTARFERLGKTRFVNGGINQRHWAASQFKRMVSRQTLSSLRRAEGRIANRLNSAALNSVIVCSEPTCLRLASRSHPRPSVPTAPCAAWQSSAAYTAGNRSHRAGNQSELPGGGFIDFVSKDSVAW